MSFQALCGRRILLLEQKIFSISRVFCNTASQRYLFICTDCSAFKISSKNVNKTLRHSQFSPLWSTTRVLSSKNEDSGSSAKNKKESKKIFKFLNFKPRFRMKYVEQIRAINDYLLTIKDLESIPAFETRSAYKTGGKDKIYFRTDVEKLAIGKFGSLENLEKERVKKDQCEESLKIKESIHKEPTSQVVQLALIMNAVITSVKFVAYLYTGSSSLFSETIHSLFDTINQCALMWASEFSSRAPDSRYPYGYSKFHHLVALMSGFYLFGIGSAVSICYGVHGLFHLGPLENVGWGYAVLGISFFCESVSFRVAVKTMMKEAKAKNLSYAQYLLKGNNPIVTMVIFEDGAALLGVLVAAGCMCLSSTYFQAADPIGSLLIGGVLGGVAYAVFSINIKCIDERAIPRKEFEGIRSFLENDTMIRSVHDAKAIEMDGKIKFKGEINYDSLEITRDYLRTQDKQQMLKELESIKTEEDLEKFMLKHGEQIVDNVGSQTDRIEKSLQNKFPRVRHIDLEAL